MKKTLSLMLVLLALLLAACGQTDNGGSQSAAPGPAATGTAAIDSLKTMGDVFALGEMENEQNALYGDYYIYAFVMDNTFYRVIAIPPEDVAQAMWDMDWSEDDYEVKLHELASPLEIEYYENLSDTILTQEELDALVGKTGQELFDEGWTNWGWNLETMEFWMNYGAFYYNVVFDGQVDNYDDFDEEDINALIVKSATYGGIGDAANIELDDDGKIVL